MTLRTLLQLYWTVAAVLLLGLSLLPALALSPSIIPVFEEGVSIGNTIFSVLSIVICGWSLERVLFPHDSYAAELKLNAVLNTADVVACLASILIPIYLLSAGRNQLYTEMAFSSIYFAGYIGLAFAVGYRHAVLAARSLPTLLIIVYGVLSVGILLMASDSLTTLLQPIEKYLQPVVLGLSYILVYFGKKRSSLR